MIGEQHNAPSSQLGLLRYGSSPCGQLAAVRGQVLKVQSMIRAMIARRRMARKQAQRMVGKGPQPLVGKLRLRLEGGQGHNLDTAELRLALTTPHRTAAGRSAEPLPPGAVDGWADREGSQA